MSHKTPPQRYFKWHHCLCVYRHVALKIHERSLYCRYTQHSKTLHTVNAWQPAFCRKHIFSLLLCFWSTEYYFFNTRVHSEGVWFSCYIVGAPTPLNRWHHSNEQALSPKLEHIMLPCSIYNRQTWHL